MPIAKRPHTEKGPNGEDIFIIETPKPVSRRFLGVHFIDGMARTKYLRKAMRFEEEFGYTVTLPVGFKGWKQAKSDGRAERAEDYGPDVNIAPQEEEEDSESE